MGGLGEINEAIDEAGDVQEAQPAEEPLGPGGIHDVMDFNGLL